MTAVLTAFLSDLRRRRLQTAVVAVILFLTSGTATLAMSLAIETDAPFDHAFAAASGAHLTLTYDPHAVSTARLKETSAARPVTQSAGPWPETISIYQQPSSDPSQGVQVQGLVFVGRSSPNTAVDRLTMEAGRWVQHAGEVVVSQHLADQWGMSIGSTIQSANGGPGGNGTSVTPGAGSSPNLTVVGIAASINPSTDAWVTPAQVRALASRQFPLQYQMLYRVRPAATAAQLRAATQAITKGLPPGAVVAQLTYLDAKRSADLTSSVMVPFLLAFSGFALAATILIISNVVAGVAIAAYRDIGVMKSVGFTPGQVTLVLLGQILAPGLAGCLLGMAAGTVAAQPFLRDTAHALGLPAPFTASIPVDLAVVVLAVAVMLLAALIPARRAAGASAVTAITLGSAPAVSGPSALAQAVERLPLPRAFALGAGDTFARPVRASMTAGAILTGVATLVFGLSLHLSLSQVLIHLTRSSYAQVEVDRMTSRPPGGLKGGFFPNVPLTSDRKAVHLIASNPGTARFVSEAQTQVTAPGIAEQIPFTGYRGSSDWLGFALISGRWMEHPNEVVAPTHVLRQAHLHVGQSITLRAGSHAARVRIVGEILDQEFGALVLRGSWQTLTALAPHVTPDLYEVQVKPGTNLRDYVDAISQPTLDASPSDRGMDATFILFNAVIGSLAAILVAIALAGVFNTVILNTREKARDIAILKAVGMAPLQVVAMVVGSVALLGVIAGILGIPLGYALHREVLTLMGQIATDTAIPPPFFDLIPHALLPVLALCGIAIAALGAWLPAQRAASAGVAEVLQAE